MAHAPGVTTDLSATLLSHAARGESIPEVDSLLRALAAGPAGQRIDESLATLVRVGHSSGIALATGIHAAAKASLELRPPRRQQAHGVLRFGMLRRDRSSDRTEVSQPTFMGKERAEAQDSSAKDAGCTAARAAP
jgi:hypothetical protein